MIKGDLMSEKKTSGLTVGAIAVLSAIVAGIVFFWFRIKTYYFPGIAQEDIVVVDTMIAASKRLGVPLRSKLNGIRFKVDPDMNQDEIRALKERLITRSGGLTPA